MINTLKAVKTITPPHLEKKTRQSGIELLRIIAMLFVVIQHVNGFGNASPCDKAVAIQSPMYCSLRFFIESVVIVGVNVFVLISGWFGIRASYRGLLKFVFQIVFLDLLVYAVLVAFGQRELSLRHIISQGTSLGYWFVHSYLLLYILSPVLNMFADAVSKKGFIAVLIMFYAYQTFYGWIYPTSGAIAMGYSPISFMGLYLLARYIRIHGDGMSCVKNKWLIFTIVGIILLNTLSALMLARFGFEGMIDRLYYYCSPFLIIQALALVVLFYRLNLSSKVINWVASSCFAVYLIHMHPMGREYFLDYVADVWKMGDGLTIFMKLAILVFSTYIVSILIDQLRVCAWNLVSKYIPQGSFQSYLDATKVDEKNRINNYNNK